MKSVAQLFCAAILAGTAMLSHADDDLRGGAVLYQQRCVLCHGLKGMGDGLLPIQIDNYPDTNLLVLQTATTLQEIVAVIEMGGFHGTDGSTLSPPWFYELSETNIEKVATFIHFLRRDTIAATEMLEENPAASEMSGKAIFQTRCVICHGNSGRGDGRLSDVINAPKPANLIVSQLTLAELLRIISGGGAAMHRSPQMPPWGQELGDHYVEKVANFVLTLRESSDESD